MSHLSLAQRAEPKKACMNRNSLASQFRRIQRVMNLPLRKQHTYGEETDPHEARVAVRERVFAAVLNHSFTERS